MSSKQPVIAFDLDDTVSSNPDLFGFLAQAITAAGGTAVIATGNPKPNKTLKKLGLDGVFSEVEEMPYEKGMSETDKAAVKAKWLVKRGVDLLIDNGSLTCLAATESGVDAALYFPGTGL